LLGKACSGWNRSKLWNVVAGFGYVDVISTINASIVCAAEISSLYGQNMLYPLHNHHKMLHLAHVCNLHLLVHFVYFDIQGL
jgi:hypothetical protein